MSANGSPSIADPTRVKIPGPLGDDAIKVLLESCSHHTSLKSLALDISHAGKLFNVVFLKFNSTLLILICIRTLLPFYLSIA